MLTPCYLVLIGLVSLSHGLESENVETTKVFVLTIDPRSFNWTTEGYARQGYWFRTSLLHKVDLPDWISYTFNFRRRSALLYGVPPPQTANYTVEIVAVNRDTYESQRKIINLNVTEKKETAKFEVEMKIDNMNVEDMLEEERLQKLMEVFTKVLWPDSSSDLYLTFLDSALKMGARRPLRPNDKDGVVVRLGSGQEFSQELLELREEVKPLARLSSCPRDFKRTTVDRHFRAGSFALDWCSFKLDGDTKAKANNEIPVEPLDWDLSKREKVPERRYLVDLMTTLVLPSVILLVMSLLLSLVLCFHHDSLFDPDSDNYFDTLMFCDKYFRRDESEETLTQYEAVQRATNSLRSLSTVRDPSPRLAGETGEEAGRPNPPPYTTVRRNVHQEDS